MGLATHCRGEGLGGEGDGLDAAAAGVGEETLGEHARELGFALDQHAFEAGDIGEPVTAGEFAGGVDGRFFLVGFTPRTDGIEFLQRKSRAGRSCGGTRNRTGCRGVW